MMPRKLLLLLGNSHVIDRVVLTRAINWCIFVLLLQVRTNPSSMNVVWRRICTTIKSHTHIPGQGGMWVLLTMRKWHANFHFHALQCASIQYTYYNKANMILWVISIELSFDIMVMKNTVQYTYETSWSWNYPFFIVIRERSSII